MLNSWLYFKKRVNRNIIGTESTASTTQT